MQDDINDIIAKHLPSQVGEVLRKRLTQADALEVQVKEKQREIELQREKIVKLEETKASALEILKREQALVVEEAEFLSRSRGLDAQQAVLTARGDIINILLERDERILGLVFGNNRFKYSQNVTEQVAFAPAAPSAQQPYPCPQSAQQSRSVVVEGEGQVPAQPTGPITPQR